MAGRKSGHYPRSRASKNTVDQQARLVETAYRAACSLLDPLLAMSSMQWAVLAQPCNTKVRDWNKGFLDLLDLIGATVPRVREPLQAGLPLFAAARSAPPAKIEGYAATSALELALMVSEGAVTRMQASYRFRTALDWLRSRLQEEQELHQKTGYPAVIIDLKDALREPQEQVFQELIESVFESASTEDLRQLRADLSFEYQRAKGLLTAQGAAPPPQASAAIPKVGVEVLALIELGRSDDLSVSGIAERVGCSRQHLYKLPVFQEALAQARERARNRLAVPRGQIDAETGQLEAW